MAPFILSAVARRPIVPEVLKQGPFTIADARRVGIERWHLKGASWNRLGPRSYMWSGLHETTLSKLAAASQRLPPIAAFSGLTAAWLHGLDTPPSDAIEVTVPKELGISTRAGIRLRRAALPEAEVVRSRGLRVTTVVRTVAEICCRLELVDAVVVTDSALRRRKVRISQLIDWANGHKGSPGINKLRRVMSFTEPAAESPMESRLRMVLVLGGLPRPRVQFPIHDDQGRFVGRPDLYYEHARLGIEYDGGTHRSSLAEDNRRQNKLLQQGVRLLRFTSRDVLHDPASVVLQVRTILQLQE